MTTPNIVYHYCDVNTFFDIISKSTIRMSNILKCNDSEELTYILSKYRNWVSQLLNQYNNRLDDTYKLSNDFVDNAFNYRLNEISTAFYISCFSENSDLLSQWRGYANDARGVAIGISTDTFNLLLSNSKEYYNFAKVKYEDGDLDLSILDYIHKEIDEKWSDNSKQDSLLLMNSADNMVLALVYNSILYKNPTFNEEKEWRLIYKPFGNIRSFKDKSMYYDRMNEMFKCGHETGGFIRNPMEFKIKENKIVSYIDLSFSNIKTNFIKEIVIGSKANLQDMDLELFLLSNGYNPRNIKIQKSKIPYR